MKKTSVILGVAALMAGAAAAAPYMVGRQVENRFEHHVAKLSARLDQPIEIVSYERGWLGAHAITRIEIEGDPARSDDNVTIGMAHDIVHGPFATFGWAEIESRPSGTFNGPSINHYFDEPPYTLTTRLDFRGDMNIHLVSPAFDKPAWNAPKAHLTWGGLEAHYRVSGNQAELTLSIPAVEFRGPGELFSIDNLRLTSAGSTMQNLGVAGQPVDWNGDSSLTIEHVAVRSAERDLDAELSFETSLTTRADDAGHLGITSTTRFDTLTVNSISETVQQPVEIKNATLIVALEGLPTKPLEALLVELKALEGQLRDASKQERAALGELAGAIVLKHAPRLLRATPALTIEIPAFQTAHGELGGKITARLTAPETGAMPLLIAVLQRLNIDAHAFAGQELLMRRLLASQPPQEVRQTLQALVARNLLKLEDGRYSVTAHYGPEQFTINGQSRPRMLSGLLGGT